MCEDYQVIEHMADIGLKVFGKTREKLFENAARGMFFIITGSSGFTKKKNQHHLTIKCDGTDIEDLLVKWLSELLYIHTADLVILNDFSIGYLTDNHLQAKSRSIKINRSPYNIEMEIKAVTYHNLQVIKNEKGCWETTIVFDI